MTFTEHLFGGHSRPITSPVEKMRSRVCLQLAHNHTVRKAQIQTNDRETLFSLRKPYETGETAQWLRALAALAENPGLLFCIHTVAHNCL